MFTLHVSDVLRHRRAPHSVGLARDQSEPVARLEDVLGVLDRGLVRLVMDGGKFLGLITRSDLLAQLLGRLE